MQCAWYRRGELGCCRRDVATGGNASPPRHHAGAISRFVRSPDAARDWRLARGDGELPEAARGTSDRGSRSGRRWQSGRGVDRRAATCRRSRHRAARAAREHVCGGGDVGWCRALRRWPERDVECAAERGRVCARGPARRLDHARRALARRLRIRGGTRQRRCEPVRSRVVRSSQRSSACAGASICTGLSAASKRVSSIKTMTRWSGTNRPMTARAFTSSARSGTRNSGCIERAGCCASYGATPMPLQRCSIPRSMVACPPSATKRSSATSCASPG